jgi:hypothetical protein
MGCLSITNGADYICGGFQKKYFQQIVLVNRADLDSWSIQLTKFNAPSFSNPANPIPPPKCAHRVFFRLKENKTGYRFEFPEKGSTIFGSFTKSESNNRTEYTHRIQISLFGVNEAFKCLLRSLDNANYFAAIQFMDGTVEIFGFEYGLTTNDYTYDPQGFGGGSLIELVSDKEALEDEAPFVYSSNGNENEDFNNNFDNNPIIELGDFNDDFNNDFFVTAV